MKRYLRQFLSDKRVVDTSRLLWWPLLRGVILPIRSPRVAKLYQSVWMEEGSPLMVYSRRQQQALAARLPDTPVALGMSYGSPSLASAVDDLLAQGVEHIVVLPLYPQYSCSTVAAVWDELARILAKKRAIPGISFIRDYAEHPDYIHALAASVRASFAVHGEPDLLLLSYHGIPQRYANQGDDYPQRCRDTTRELVSALGLPPERVMMTFQSRFGREPWLTPYTDETLKMLGEKGTKHIQVLCPGFAADCLETLEEIAVQNREIFLEAGGKQYEYIPALNADAAHIEMMVNLTAPYR
ncbi:ferrochelatase [Klebsiella pneumoniae]|nr:Ferrochelatase [Klebsiella pneumoniae]STU42478.1 ferrochelatase [Klebsiella pneumoniae]STU90166.1 ferrochelatase [Klebsiella pneumoniae]STV57690.1 ferrochelatase [Klebsiella pneumoniae]